MIDSQSQRAVTNKTKVAVQQNKGTARCVHCGVLDFDSFLGEGGGEGVTSHSPNQNISLFQL